MSLLGEDVTNRYLVFPVCIRAICGIATPACFGAAASFFALSCTFAATFLDAPYLDGHE
jgi:hypothetical protein